MRVRIRGRDVLDVQLRIYERRASSREFARALLHRSVRHHGPDLRHLPGRLPDERSLAIEQACGITVDGPIRELRRLLYCGEWIESHALHIYLLHAPDFLGYESAIHMAADHPALVERGLATRKAGNQVLITLGGRAEHPVNPRTGGPYRAPRRKELQPLVEPLQRALEETLETIALTGTLTMPDFERDYEFVALQDNDGRTRSTEGGSFRAAASTSRPRPLMSILSRSTSRTRMPWTVDCATAARTWSGPSRGSLAFDTLSPMGA